MGLQTLSVLVAGDPSVLAFHVFKGVDPLMMPLNVTAAAAGSRMFASLSDEVGGAERRRGGSSVPSLLPMSPLRPL
jgi:hypothetical protein